MRNCCTFAVCFFNNSLLICMNVRNPFKITISPNRIYGLDILRAAAILFVVLLHGCFITPDRISEKVGIFLLDGVSIFFVLSRFLIGGILIKILAKEKPNFTTLFGFWKRRWYRTLPNYYLLLFIHIMIALIFVGSVNLKEIVPLYNGLFLVLL